MSDFKTSSNNNRATLSVPAANPEPTTGDIALESKTWAEKLSLDPTTEQKLKDISTSLEKKHPISKTRSTFANALLL